MKSTLIKTLSLVFFLITFNACNKVNPKQGYKEEANSICALFDQKRLNMIFSDPKTSKLNQLAIDTRNTLKSNEFKAIFTDLETSDYRDYYAALQPKVSKLLGEEWHCPDMQKHYDIVMLNPRTPKDSSGKYKRTKIRITPAGLIKIYNESFTFTKTQVWLKKLRKMIIAEKPWLITVLIPEEKYTDNDVEPLLTLFKTLNFDPSQYSFRQYRISEYEALEKINANNP